VPVDFELAPANLGPLHLAEHCRNLEDCCDGSLVCGNRVAGNNHGSEHHEGMAVLAALVDEDLAHAGTMP
jgi:hypothetical protein